MSSSFVHRPVIVPVIFPQVAPAFKFQGRGFSMAEINARLTSDGQSADFIGVDGFAGRFYRINGKVLCFDFDFSRVDDTNLSVGRDPTDDIQFILPLASEPYVWTQEGLTFTSNCLVLLRFMGDALTVNRGSRLSSRMLVNATSNPSNGNFHAGIGWSDIVDPAAPSPSSETLGLRAASGQAVANSFVRTQGFNPTSFGPIANGNSGNLLGSLANADVFTRNEYIRTQRPYGGATATSGSLRDGFRTSQQSSAKRAFNDDATLCFQRVGNGTLSVTLRLIRWESYNYRLEGV